MPKYDFIYTMSNGAFMMEVCTGYYIIAANRTKAMQAAERLDRICSESFDLQCTFELTPIPHISARGSDRVHRLSRKPRAITFKVQRHFDSSSKLLDFPVFSDEDFQSVTEADFIKELIETYSEDMNTHHKTFLSFDCISYGVMDQESR